MEQDLERAIQAAGPRLKELRQQQNLTLADVEERTQISKSTISRLESGSRRATLELLLPLARIYGVTLDELVKAPPSRDARVKLQPIKRDGMTLIPLTRRAGDIQAYKIIILKGQKAVPELRSHEGYEWLYVLNGRLRLVLGDEDMVLEPGEAAEFDTQVPHWFGTESGSGVELLSLFGQHGERAHARVR
ncbi:MAG: helix-turn-helix domain-containing protein [Dehalococcoidia bacterium]